MSFPRPPRKEESTFDQWMLRLWQWLKDSTDFAFGTLAEQNADAVAITGGAVDGTVIGGVAEAAGSFTTITAISTVSLSGTAANIATGVNYISYSGTDAGLSFDSSNNATLSGTLKLGNGGSNFFLGIQDNSYYMRIHGSNAVNQGAGITLFGGTHVTLPNVGRLLTGSSTVAEWNGSGHIGIGISPTYQLDVRSALTGTTVGSNRIFNVSSNASGRDAHIGLGDNVNSSAQIGYLSGDLYFRTNSTERMRIGLTGGITTSSTISVGAATPSSSGAGITFPATQSASTNTNTLDDYEEGTFTPLLVGSTSGSVALGGKYRKVGDRVTCWITSAAAITAGTLVGNLSITGLPFTSQGPYGDARDTMMIPIPWIRGSSDTTANIRFGAINNGATSIQLFSASTFGDTNYYPGASSNFPAANITQNGTTAVYMCLSFSYLYQ